MKMVVGHIYCVKKVPSGQIREAEIIKEDNGFGYAILKRIDDPTKFLFWDIDKPPKGFIFYKKHEIGKQ